MIFRDHYTRGGHQVRGRRTLLRAAPGNRIPPTLRGKAFHRLPSIYRVSGLEVSPGPSPLLSTGSRVDNFLVIRSALAGTEESSPSSNNVGG